jgi:hypothetical protein
MKSAEKFPGGTALHKELQGFASFIAYQNTCYRTGTAMTGASQGRLIAGQYFGNPNDPDSIGLCEQLVEGTGIFQHLYDIEDIQQQTSAQRTTTTSNDCHSFTLVLKPHLHMIANTKIVVGSQPNNINLSLLR